MGTTYLDAKGRLRQILELFPHAPTHRPSTGTDPLPTGMPLSVGTANAAGTGDAFARHDHVHGHGAHTDPAAHAAATAGAAGFFTPALFVDLLSAKRLLVARTIVNRTGSSITKATPVASGGFDLASGLLKIVKADKDDPARRPAMGVLLTDVANDAWGEVLVVGFLDGVDTSAFALTDQLVLGTNGTLIRPPPDTFPFTGEIQLLAHVVLVGAGDGVLAVNAQGLIPITEIEVADHIMNPEGIVSGQATRSTSLTFEGAAFLLHREVDFNRLIVKASAVPTAGDFTMAVYQAGSGGSGVASKMASVGAFAVSSTGVKTLTPDEGGTIILSPGLCYVLFGKRTGNFSMSALDLAPVDLWTTSDVPAAGHPVGFTTALPTSSIPSTFDPRTVGGGGQATPASGALALQLRLATV